MGLEIIGTGSYVPDNVVTNEQLKHTHGFDPAWIEQRSGIQERRHLPGEFATSDMSAEAGARAIRSAGVKPEDIDLLVLGTFTPDHFCPSTACLVQDRLGLEVPAFDVSAACSGFMYCARDGRTIHCDRQREDGPRHRRGHQQPLHEPARSARLSPFWRRCRRGDPHARWTGAGARALPTGADGGGGPLLVIPGGGTRVPASASMIQAGDQYVRMDGRQVFKWAVRVRFPTRWHSSSRMPACRCMTCRSICCTRRISGSSTPPSISWAFPKKKSSTTFNDTATRRAARFPSPSTRRSAPAASSPATR